MPALESDRHPYDECSIYSESTGATASDLPGAGRILGRLYSAGGAVVERHLNKIGKALGINPRQKTISLLPDASYDSLDEQAPNLPGPGRALGLFYDYTGVILEKRIGRLAIRYGFGPDAAMQRIRSRLAQKEYKHAYLFLESLREKGKLADDCMRLIKYARSDVTQNREIALEHITTLAMEDAFLRLLLSHLGAIDTLRSFEPCGSEFCDADMDPLLSQSRKALVCLEEVGVHAVGQRLVKHQHKLNASLLLIDALGDPQVSFLAARYLAQNMEGFSLDMSAPFCTKLGEKAIDVVCRDDEDEWQTMDALIERCMMEYERNRFSFIYRGTSSSHFNTGIIKLYATVINAPQRLPSSAQHLLESVRFNDHSLGDHRLWPVVAIQRELLLNSLRIRRIALDNPHYSKLVSGLRNSTNSALEQCVVDVIRARSGQIVYKDHLNVYVVIKPKKLASLTAQMAGIIIRSDESSRMHVLECMMMMRRLDRYCWNSLQDALLCWLSSSNEESTSIPITKTDVWRLASTTAVDLRAVQFEFLSINLTRMFLPQTNRHHYCRVIHDGKGDPREIWWPPLPRISYSPPPQEGFQALYEYILRLDVPPKAAFHTDVHHALLAGYNEYNQKEYIAVLAEREVNVTPRICFVKEGDKVAQYTDDNGIQRQAEHFRVLVLRFDFYDYGPELLQTVSSMKGIDHTGPLYWL